MNVTSISVIIDVITKLALTYMYSITIVSNGRKGESEMVGKANQLSNDRKGESAQQWSERRISSAMVGKANQLSNGRKGESAQQWSEGRIS